MKRLFACIAVSILLVSCSTNEVKEENISVKTILLNESFNISYPTSCKEIAPNKSKDEILKLNYNDELFIIIQDNLGDIIKSSSAEESSSLKLVQQIKFNSVKSAYKGFNPSDITTSAVNGMPFISQSFMSKANIGDIYYDYRLMKIKGKYYEFLVTGVNTSRAKHKSIISNLYSSIHL